MFLDIRLQEKTGTVVLTAPDGTIYPFQPAADADDEKKNQLLQSLGQTVMEIVMDPDMPEEQITALPGSRAPGGAGRPETAVRTFMESMLPGSSRLLDGLQGISSDEE